MGHGFPRIDIETLKEQPTGVARLPAWRALLAGPTHEAPDETPLRCRARHLSTSIDDLMNPLMTQVERVCDIPHRHARRMEPPDGLVIFLSGALCLRLQRDKARPHRLRVVEKRLIGVHDV
jgi:hypothetical protein